MGLGQRVVLVIGLGAALLIVSRAITRGLTGRRPFSGWTGYMPLARGRAVYGPVTPHPWIAFVIHLVLLAIWIAGSLFLLRRAAGRGAADDAGGPGPASGASS